MPTAPNLVLFFGRLHPLLVHLPIGFLTLLAIVEVASRFKRFKGVGEARGIILFFTVLATIVTITCGLMLSTGGGYDASLLFWHKWMGITMGIAVVISALAFRKGQVRVYAGLLVIVLLLLGPASHFGGSMTHGKNYLFAYAPLWLRPPSETPPPAIAAAQAARTAADAGMFIDVVRPVFAQNCVACHGNDRASGGLRLDSFASITRGGQSGAAIVPTNPTDSLLIQRVSLPIQDARHMPPDGKPQLSDDQVDALKWWIASGAPEQKTVGDVNPTGDQTAMVSRLLHLPDSTDAAAAVPPIAIADAQTRIATLSPKMGIVVTPFAVDQPWIIVNAAMNHSFGDGDLQQLSNVAPNIVDLNLAATHVTDAGLQSVEAMANLKRLRLDRTAITDAGLIHLAGLKKLDYLNLYSTAVTDQGLSTLAKLPNLRHLYLWKTKVDPAAVAAFTATKTDLSAIARIKKQIEMLKAQISSAEIEVVQGITPAATRPTTVP